MSTIRRLLSSLLLLPSFAAGDPRALTIEDEDAPHVFVSIGQESEFSNGIGIFQRTTGRPYATFLDKDGDGVFDLLTYSVLDAHGDIISEVEDYGMDGQADFKLNFRDRSAEVFYLGEWREVQGFGERDPWIEYGDRQRPLKEVLAELGRDGF